MINSRYLLACWFLISQSALAHSPTIERIKQTGIIQLGYSETTVPFSYIDPNTQQHYGFSHDLYDKIVERFRQDFQLPELQVKYVLFTAKNRWELHKNHEVDLSCIAATNTTERQQKYADFSYGYFVSGARMLVPKALGVHHYKDLEGRVVGVMKNSASRQFIFNKKDTYHFKELSIENNMSEAYERLKNGEIDALVYDDVSLASQLYRDREHGDQYEIIGKPMTAENYGCTMQLHDQEFKLWVNQTLHNLIQQKEIHAMYDKWFVQPIPPQNQSFNFPMSDATKRLLAVPSDKAVGQLD
ncbi:MAG: transporter substrate-binding domain-containing protein [Cardiobacteriaceae bacterium]|nr:transporter substrate-binding domain-containing protein [Cardiobacteriaceae bacterium]